MCVQYTGDTKLFVDGLSLQLALDVWTAKEGVVDAGSAHSVVQLSLFPVNST